MADQGGASAVLDSLVHGARIAYSFQWSRYLSWITRFISFPFRVMWIPFPYIAHVLAVIFAPVTYLLSYFTAWCNGVIAFLASLQFGTAAAVGIIAGITLATSSSIITTYLGMQEDPYDTARKEKKALPSSASSRDGSSSNETEWYWTEPSPSRRRPATGLLSQTIMEEDDSDI
ncbi:hypothetical protein PT974_06649 [Cladobotryum mycophilum]|uniref:Golgi apparatus membrane protein TVP38 n=1 Tax=Cladobotryum mycophilum TaxID=491253 RepID=A0ABR0SM33_9HYPO